MCPFIWTNLNFLNSKMLCVKLRLKLAQYIWRKRFQKVVNPLSLLCYYMYPSLERTWSVCLNKLESSSSKRIKSPSSQNMVFSLANFAKFGWNWPWGSRKIFKIHQHIFINTCTCTLLIRMISTWRREALLTEQI